MDIGVSDSKIRSISCNVHDYGFAPVDKIDIMYTPHTPRSRINYNRKGAEINKKGKYIENHLTHLTRLTYDTDYENINYN